MFKLFKKKSEIEKLQALYKKTMKNAFLLQSKNRSASDQKYVEADLILKKINTLNPE